MIIPLYLTIIKKSIKTLEVTTTSFYQRELIKSNIDCSDLILRDYEGKTYLQLRFRGTVLIRLISW